MTSNSPPPFFVVVVGSGIRDKEKSGSATLHNTVKIGSGPVANFVGSAAPLSVRLQNSLYEF
jgi:hypothetical protein